MRSRYALSVSAALLGLATNAAAQYVSDFEGLNASATGTVLTAQDAYYIPPATTSIDYNAFTYAGNSLGVVANPTGGDKFISGTGPGNATFARAQRDMAYGPGKWTCGFDVLALYTLAVLPTAQNIGSFSVQPFPGGQSFIALATWTDVNTALTWNADYIWFDAGGNQLQEPVPDPAFQNLVVNHWYRWETDIDFDTNEILEVRLTDITGGSTATHNPIGRYMFGGTAGATPATGFRFFAGGGVDGNSLSFDNPKVRRTMGPIGMTTSDCPALPNSGGQVPIVGLAGTGDAGDDVLGSISNGLPGEFGYFISGPNGGIIPAGCGIVCIGGPQFRYNSTSLGHIFQFDAAGNAGPITLQTDGSFGGVPPVMSGETRRFEGWFRDAGCTMPGQGYNFTDVVSVTFN